MVRISATKQEMAAAAANHAGESLRMLLNQKNVVRILAATGASQFEFLELLTADKTIDWSRVELFHLDEYVGLGGEHPASFARYINERVLTPTGISRFHLLDGTQDPGQVASRVGAAIRFAHIDLAFVGIGENGHVAFNDPPANFDTDDPYLIVELDQACRQQQVGEGWFATLDDVPRQAITISIRQLLRANEIICVVPDRRKASAVKAALEGPLCSDMPASVLRVHPNTTIYLDQDSASLLSRALSAAV